MGGSAVFVWSGPSSREVAAFRTLPLKGIILEYTEAHVAFNVSTMPGQVQILSQFS